jgi:hypothetical protein
LPAECSGWALLQNMLPLLIETKKSKEAYVCMHDALCTCTATISIDLSVFGEDVNSTLISKIRDFPFFIELKTRLPTEKNMKSNTTSIISLAWAAFFASPALQDTANDSDPLCCEIVGSSSNGISLRAAVSDDTVFTGREEESAAIINAVKAVMDGTLHEARRVVLLYGDPGLGKSLLATRALYICQRDFAKDLDSRDVRVEIIRGRGAAVVEEDLLALGHSLGGAIGVVSGSPQDVVLAALQHLFKNSRYVLLIDDADAEGLSHVLQFLPVSEQPRALIITSQSLTCASVKGQLLIVGDVGPIQFHKRLQLFSPQECMMLMSKVCKNCDALLRFDALLRKEDELRAVFGDGLGYLPLAVRLFANWSRMQFTENMKPHLEDKRIKWQAAFNSAKMVADNAKMTKDDRKLLEDQFEINYEAATGHGAAAADALLLQWKISMDSVVLQADAKYTRGLLGTVRLALLQLQSLRSDVKKFPKEASKQLLGLLSLCPPVQVPWSLFDGGTKGEAQLLVRGARVEVTGTSLEYVSPVGERCRVTRMTNGGALLKEPLYARVVSDRVEGGQLEIESCDGRVFRIPTEHNIEFDPHIGGQCYKDGICTLQLQTPVPATGVKVYIKDNSKLHHRSALIKSHFLSQKTSAVAADESLVTLTLLSSQSSELRNVNLPNQELQLKLKDVFLPHNVTVIDNQLLLSPRRAAPVTVSARKGRVMQHHTGDETVSVVFGCDTGK